MYQTLSDLGWINTFWALIVPRAADAFGIFFLRQFFLSLPQDLDSAARIDGASGGPDLLEHHAAERRIRRC